MILTGIGDEAGDTLETQIQATRELGWRTIEARNITVPATPTCWLPAPMAPAGPDNHERS